MEISPEFLSVEVWPMHGLKSAIVSWSVSTAILSGDFYVYYSPDGMGEWRLLNDTPVGALVYEDDNFQIADKSRIPHYRVVCEHGGNTYESATIGLFEKITRSELGFVNKVSQEELLRMRGGNGLQVFYYPALIGGLPCNFIDKETNKHIGHGCAGTELDCYNTGIVGGYRKPLIAWAELYTRTPSSGSFRKPKLGETDEQFGTIRLLIPFVPQIRDLIVLPHSNDRYEVGEQTKVHRFKGVVPVTSDVTAELLPRNHDAYRLQRPQGVL